MTKRGNRNYVELIMLSRNMTRFSVLLLASLSSPTVGQTAFTAPTTPLILNARGAAACADLISPFTGVSPDAKGNPAAHFRRSKAILAFVSPQFSPGEYYSRSLAEIDQELAPSNWPEGKDECFLR